MSTKRNTILGPILAFGLLSPFIMNCGAAAGIPGAPKLPDAPGSCSLDMANLDAIAKADFVGEFKLQADGAAKLKAGVQAAVELKEFAAKIDADLKEACGGLAKDLGGTADYKAESGETTCKAALKLMGDVKGKLGANAKIAVDIRAPRCDASMDVMADCAGKCDASVKGGQAKVECEPGKLSGSCSGECSGRCDVSGGAKCDGTCEGSCDVSFKGTCEGKCNGKCDGKNTQAECKGTCEGSCDAHGKGECKGKCGGSCQLKAKAKCDGTCAGSCSAEMKAPKCEGEVTPPKVSAECKAHCDAEVNGKLECTPATVGIRVDGAADAKAAATYKAALEKNLPLVLKVAIGMAGRAEKMADGVKVMIEGLQVTATEMAKASSDPAAALKLTSCVVAPFKGAIDAAASIKANVNVSVNVKASAEAKGSAGGKAG